MEPSIKILIIMIGATLEKVPNMAKILGEIFFCSPTSMKSLAGYGSGGHPDAARPRPVFSLPTNGDEPCARGGINKMCTQILIKLDMCRRHVSDTHSAAQTQS